MPTYEYECTKCGQIFEVFHSITSKPRKTIKTDCEQCDNKAPVRRLLGTGGGVIFKGSGFYETDYRSESYKTAAKAEREAATGGDSGKKDGKQSSEAGGGKKATKAKASDKGPSAPSSGSTSDSS